DMERGCWDYFKRLDAMGGMVSAIEQGFPQREIQDAAYTYQKAVERQEKIIVGVNDFVSDEPALEILLIDESVAERQIARTRRVRETRDNDRWRSTLDALKQAAVVGNLNLMPFVLDCVRAYATLGEICDTLRAVYGTYEEPVV
ncbi:MAG TPA: methylmalonyl-CoA mutase family protein, partial [Terriglobia bacterium]|nr:methylmalonyl-CoA mutase family protein [Terriglobia bacterium]